MSQLDWNATVDILRESLPQTQFQNWFKPLRLIRTDERSIVLGVPSRFHEEWLRSHYAHHIHEAIQKQCGNSMQLEFEVLQTENSDSTKGVVAHPSPARTHLRVVGDMGAATAAALHTEPEPASAPAADPSQPLPTFGQPFFSLGFNYLAYQCALMMAQGNPTINPLVITGGVGMGKSHLLAELGREMKTRNPGLRVRYTTAEAFTAEMVSCLKTDRMLQFKRKYREETDCLLFDDFQILSRRTRTQEELLHIFNEIMGRGGKIAFACSVAPQKLEDIIQPLKSRVLSAVIADLRPPTFDEKVQMLGHICEHNKIFVEATVLSTLAEGGQKDIRELVGGLLRAHLQATIENRPLDQHYISQDGFKDENAQHAVTLEEIITLVEHNFGVSRTELVSKSRKSITTWARQVAMYLARHFTLMPLEQIGKSLGRDHATVIHAFQKVTETMEQHPTRRYQVEFLMQKLQSQTGTSPVVSPDGV